MEFIPFQILNQALEKRLKNINLYSDENFSFLKIVQHGLSYSMLQSKNKLLKTYFHLPFFLQVSMYSVRGLIKGGKWRGPTLQKFVLYDEGRIFESSTGEVQSMYFHKLENEIGIENCTRIRLGGDQRLSAQYTWSDFANYEGSLDDREKIILKSINNCLKRLSRSNEFTGDEMKYVESAFHVFFVSFRQHYRVLIGSKIKAAFFCVHYHKEGLIAALKVLGIQSIEVQHGLISANDFYYVYHKQFAPITSRAFFPDKILLYGNYWRNVLSRGAEWTSDQLIVVGNYLANAKTVDSIPFEKQNIIFIGAQKNLARAYTDYCILLQKLIKAKGYDWRIVVKMHPLEKTPDIYRNELVPLGIEILWNESNLFECLAKCRIQISIYSTTFFDSLGMNVLNLSLQDYTNSSDYAKEMVTEGVALPLSLDQDPIHLLESLDVPSKYFLDSKDVYGEFPISGVGLWLKSFEK